MHLHRLVALLGLAVSATAGAQQSVVVDDAHLQLHHEGKPPAPMYEVAAASTLVLDASQYDFKVPAEFAGKPINSVLVVAGPTQHFSAAWDEHSRRLLLSKESLTPNAGSLPFAGFSSGEQLVLAIGILDGSQFRVVWAGMANVK